MSSGRDVEKRRWGASYAPLLATAVPGLLLLLATLATQERDLTGSFGPLLEVAVCVAAGLSGLRPVGLAVAALAVLTALLGFPQIDATFATFAVLVPLVATVATGRTAAAAALTAWFLADTWLLSTDSGAPTAGELWQTMLSWAFFVSLAWLLGGTIDYQRRQRRSMTRAHAEAVHLQRRQLAQGLHDTIAQSNATIVLVAESMRAGLRPHDEMAAGLEEVIAAARRSASDLATLMEALRVTSEGVPDPLDDPAVRVEDFVRQQAETLREKGFEPVAVCAVTSADLRPDVRSTVLKVVREAGTNVVKHGAAGPCRLMVDWTPGHDAVEVVCVNRRGGAPPAGASSGLGLVGLKERVGQLGGSVEARLDTGEDLWLLSVRVPVGDA